MDLWEPDETEGWHFDPAALEALVRPDTKLVVWNLPHNPTGALPPPADFHQMVAAVTRVGAWLYSDEMYRLLERTADSRLPAAVDVCERAVSLGGMSKAFGLAGLRIGWVAVRDAWLLERIKSLKDYTTICSSAPSELLALMALRSREPILAANLARIEEEPAGGCRLLWPPLGDVHLGPPSGGHGVFSAAPRCCGRGAAGRGAAGRRRKRSAHACSSGPAVLLLPSTVYSYGDSHFRLGLGRKDFGAGLEVLDEYLGALAERVLRPRRLTSRNGAEGSGTFRTALSRIEETKSRGFSRCPRTVRTPHRRSGAGCADSPCSLSCPHRGSRSPGGILSIPMASRVHTNAAGR